MPRVQVLKKAAEKRELVTVALNTHGTRAVQKLIETLTTREQVRRAAVLHSCFPSWHARAAGALWHR